LCEPSREGLELTVPLHGTIGLVTEKLVGIVFRRQVLAVDRQNIVAFLTSTPTSGERRAVDLFLVLPWKIFGDAVAAGRRVEIRCERREGNLGPLGMSISPPAISGVGKR